jgi:hypothetical protein
MAESPIRDPLCFMAPLQYVTRVFPYGFPVDIAANSLDAIEAARESWGAYLPRFDRPPICVHVLVSEGNSVRPPEPVVRGQRHLISWVADRENFAVIDREQRFGYSCVTSATVADRVFFRWHFLDSLIHLLLELNYITSLHAACVAWEGAGVLLFGESGAGKSTVSYACARHGWTYISDDASSIVWGSQTVLGHPHRFRFRADAPEVFPELRGLTVGHAMGRKPTMEAPTANLPIRTAPDCRVERIVFLDRCAAPHKDRRAGMDRMHTDEVRRRLVQGMPVLDPVLEPQRMSLIELIAKMPAFEIHYEHFEDAVRLLEEMIQDEVDIASDRGISR